ncbi:MAG: twin-arginine translocation signal domain-containing protein [Planctomycetales bacterium]
MSISRRRFLAKTSLGAAGVALALPVTSSLFADERPLDIGRETQLFIDDFLVRQQAGLKRTLHQPKKRGLIKEADGRDWERGAVYVGKIVCQDNAGKFHMTYRYYWWDAELQKLPRIGIDKAHWFHEVVGYATSDDGIHWTKPILNRAEAPTKLVPSKTFPFETPEGLSKQNNFGYPIFFAYDLHANGNMSDPDKRFLLQVVENWIGDDPFAKPVDPQLYFAPDWPDVMQPGWKEKLTPVSSGGLSPRGIGFPMISGYDHQAREWFMTCQDVIGNWVKRGGRDIARYSTPDLVSWNGPQLVVPVAADESRDPKDWVEYMDLWGQRVGGQQTGAWLGQLWIFHADRSSPEYQTPHIKDVWRKGTTEVRLVLSRDAGRTWQRVCDRDVWLPHHEADDGYDRLPCCGCPIRVGDELRYYYACWNGDHLAFYRDGTPYYPNRMRNSSTAWATLRLDGHVSLDAGNPPGHLQTKLLRWGRDSLSVNAALSRGGLRVEVQEESGEPVAGFAAADCVPITGDGVAQPVRWKNDRDTAALAGRAVRLRFELTDGELFSFRFA